MFGREADLNPPPDTQIQRPQVVHGLDHQRTFRAALQKDVTAIALEVSVTEGGGQHVRLGRDVVDDPHVLRPDEQQRAIADL